MRSVRTAYSRRQAEVYDKKRFTDISGKAIHKMELSILKFFLKSISIKKNILEVGCGTGRLLIELSKLGYQVDGVDASKDMLKQLLKKARLNNKNIKIKRLESANLKLSKKYNFVFAIRLLNQTKSKSYALKSIKEMIRVTKPGGHILIEFVNINRPRIGRNSTKTTRLSHKIIAEANLLKNWGCDVIEEKGLFFLGMGTIISIPTFLLNIVIKVDNFLSSIFPRYCARGYVLLKKNHEIS